VERCLVQFFHKTKEEACAISRMVNDLGQAVVLGPWTFEMAEDLSMRTMDEANKVNFPFICDPVEV
jgi:ATP-dependent Clp protease adapter protein ClpS